MSTATNNERENKLNSNTFGYTSKNYKNETALSINYFNKMATVGIHLPQEGGKGDYVQFDYKSGVQGYLTAKDCKLIAKQGRKALKKYEAGQGFEGFAIPLKRGAFELVQVSDLKKKIKSISGDVDSDAIAAIIYTEMDDNKKTDKYLVHIFNQDIIIKGYEADSGKYDVEKVGDAEVEYFLDALEDFAVGLTNGRVHAQKDDDKFSRARWERMAFDLAMSLGLDLTRSSGAAKDKGKSSSSKDWSDGNRYVGNSDTGSSKAQTVEVSEQDVDDVIASML